MSSESMTNQNKINYEKAMIIAVDMECIECPLFENCPIRFLSEYEFGEELCVQTWKKYFDNNLSK